jgi:hypothetical protein
LIVQQSERFDRLDNSHKQIVAAIMDSGSSVTGSLEAQISALSLLLNRAETVITSQENTAQRIIVDVFREIASAPKLQQETILIDSIRKEDQRILRAVQMQLLESLHFPTITDRFESVSESHPNTCQWIFQRPEDTDQFRNHGRYWSPFVDWLQHGSGLYWINGKAGSGKSTLMKYIFNKYETRRHLNFWAGNQKLCIAAFFFWSGGGCLQRSQSGLYRSLLFDILRQVPELTPIVLPEQWAARYSAQCQTSMHTPVSTVHLLPMICENINNNLDRTLATSDIAACFQDSD